MRARREEREEAKKDKNKKKKRTMMKKTEERRKVPRRAIIFSTVAFCWIPYLELIGNDNESDASIDTVRSWHRILRDTPN